MDLKSIKAIITILLITMPCLLFAQRNAKVIIKGFVGDNKTKEGIENVRVFIIGRSEYSDLTDQEGIFIFKIPKSELISILKGGAFKIMAQHKNYKPSKINVTVGGPPIRIFLEKYEISPPQQCLLSPFPFIYEKYSKKNALYRKIFAGFAVSAIGTSIFSYKMNKDKINDYESRKSRRIYDSKTFKYRDDAEKWYYTNLISLGVFSCYFIHNLIDSINDKMSDNNHFSKINRTYFFVTNESKELRVNFIYVF